MQTTFQNVETYTNPNRANPWEGDGWEEDERGSKAQGPATKP